MQNFKVKQLLRNYFFMYGELNRGGRGKRTRNTLRNTCFATVWKIVSSVPRSALNLKILFCLCSIFQGNVPSRPGSAGKQNSKVPRNTEQLCRSQVNDAIRSIQHLPNTRNYVPSVQNKRERSRRALGWMFEVEGDWKAVWCPLLVIQRVQPSLQIRERARIHFLNVRMTTEQVRVNLEHAYTV